MIETLPDLLKANFNRMRPNLSPKHSLGRLKISKQTDTVNIKVINVSQLYMETGANDSLFSFKSLKKIKKKQDSNRMKKKPTNGKVLYVHFLGVLHWVEKLPIVSVLENCVFYC